jgi:hypothetical protein
MKAWRENIAHIPAPAVHVIAVPAPQRETSATLQHAPAAAYVIPNMWSLPLTRSHTQVLALFSAAIADGVLRLLASPCPNTPNSPLRQSLNSVADSCALMGALLYHLPHVYTSPNDVRAAL